MTTFDPDWVVHPGATLQDALDERRQSVTDLAQQCELPPTVIEGILGGWEPIDTYIADRLAATVGASSAFWLSHEHLFRSGLERGKVWVEGEMVTAEQWTDDEWLAVLNRFEPGVDSSLPEIWVGHRRSGLGDS